MKWGGLIDEYTTNCKCSSVFLFGFYVVKKVDEFILENKKRMSEEIQMLEPSSVILPGDLPLMEIDKEIDMFRKKHPNFKIILKDVNPGNSGPGNSEPGDRYAELYANY